MESNLIKYILVKKVFRMRERDFSNIKSITAVIFWSLRIKITTLLEKFDAFPFLFSFRFKGPMDWRLAEKKRIQM